MALAHTGEDHRRLIVPGMAEAAHVPLPASEAPRRIRGMIVIRIPCPGSA